MPAPARLGAICFILTVEFLGAQALAQAAFPNYDLLRYDISLLGLQTCGAFPVPASGYEGQLCSPLNGLFNASIILHGVLIVLGLWLTRRTWPDDPLTRLALSLLALGGVGAVVVGFFPLDGNMVMHVVGAVLALGAPGLGCLLLGRSLRSFRDDVARWSTIAGVLIVAGCLAHATGGEPFGRGLAERLAAWPQTIWYIAVGTRLLMMPARQVPAA